MHNIYSIFIVFELFMKQYAFYIKSPAKEAKNFLDTLIKINY